MHGYCGLAIRRYDCSGSALTWFLCGARSQPSAAPATLLCVFIGTHLWRSVALWRLGTIQTPGQRAFLGGAQRRTGFSLVCV